MCIYSIRFIVAHSVCEELPNWISSDQDQSITVINLEVFSPVLGGGWGNKPTSSGHFRGVLCSLLGLPWHLPIPAFLQQVLSLALTAPSYCPGLNCSVASFFHNLLTAQLAISPKCFSPTFYSYLRYQLISRFLSFRCLLYIRIVLVARRSSILK